MRITVEELFEFADYVKCWWESAGAELDEKNSLAQDGGRIFDRKTKRS